jgi:hypothetical protein
MNKPNQTTISATLPGPLISFPERFFSVNRLHIGLFSIGRV